MIEYELPYPPTINTYYRRVGAKTLISAKGREYRVRVVDIVTRVGARPYAGLVYLEMDVFPPDRRRRDIDNLLKPVLDAIQHGGVIADDYQISGLWVMRREIVDGGRLLVRLMEAPDDNGPANVPA